MLHPDTHIGQATHQGNDFMVYTTRRRLRSYFAVPHENDGDQWPLDNLGIVEKCGDPTKAATAGIVNKKSDSNLQSRCAILGRYIPLHGI